MTMTQNTWRSVLPIVFFVYNLVPDILGQLFGLGHGGECGESL